MLNKKFHSDFTLANCPLILLFVKLDLGGIETYFAKLSHTMAQERRVLVCALRKERHQGLMALFHPAVEVVSPLKLVQIILSHRKQRIDLLATGRNTALWAVLLQFLSSYVRVRLGIYSQYELSERSDGALRLIYSLVYRKLGPKCIFFCTQGLKEKQAGLDDRYIVSSVVPLTVSVPPFIKYHSGAAYKNTLKLLTVGRFVDFKRYLWTLPGLIAELEDAGIVAELYIYGYGPLEDSLKNCIQKSTLASRIYIKGKINPQDIDQALLDADLFIGSGSMLLEAASRGVPSIVCIDSNEEPTSPGYLHELPLNFTSEERDGVTMTKFSQLVQRYIDKSKSEQIYFFRSSYEYCKHYYAERVVASLISVFDEDVPNEKDMRQGKF